MSGDWRERYLKLADRHERTESSQAEAEREFTRLVTRLCVAVSGLDKALDPHLDGLREAVKAGGHLATRLRHANGIADELLRTAEGRTPPDILRNLLARGGLARRQLDEVLRLWGEVAIDPAGASNEQLDRLTDLLRSGLGEVQGAARPGLLTRLIGKVPREVGMTPNRLLLDLLQTVSWPQSLQPEVDAFRASLDPEGDGETWIRVVRQLSDLTIRAMEQAQQNARSAETFLAELSQRLEELDLHMLGEVQRRAESRLSGERLGRSMSTEVESLSDSVRRGIGLADLQSWVLASLDRMHGHVRSHLDDENARRELAEQEAAALRGQLRRLEKETFDLRRQVAQTYREAMRDALTGLPNRRAYDERIAHEVARWKRFREPLALLVWDVDDFKGVNDSFGHKAGDRALVMIGKLLSEGLRETDFIARYGGEEFVVLLTGADREDALRVAEGMRTSIEQGGLHAHGKPVRITLSGGLALFGDDDSAEAVFERADKALYQAKHQGKNRVVAG